MGPFICLAKFCLRSPAWMLSDLMAVETSGVSISHLFLVTNSRYPLGSVPKTNGRVP